MGQSKKISIGALYGLLAGLLLVGLTLGTYLGGVRVFIGPISYLGYILLIGLATTAAWIKKTRNGGFLAFQEAVKTCFTVFVIGLALQTLFYWLLLNVIDTHFRDVLSQVTLAKTQDYLRRSHFTEEEINSMTMSDKDGNTFSLGRTLMGLAMIYIALFLVSLLIAAIVRGKGPRTGDRA